MTSGTPVKSGFASVKSTLARCALTRLAAIGYLEFAFLLIFFWCLSVQIFIPPFVGLADNGDFPRVIGHFSLGADSTNYHDRYFNYFISDYYFYPQYKWESNLYSSARIFVWIAERIVRIDKPGDRFDIRWLGLVYALALTNCFALLLSITRRCSRLVRYYFPILFILVFSDVFYASFLNSFYTDTTGLIFFLAEIIYIGYMLSSASNRPYVFCVLLLLTFLLASSRPQNIVLGVYFGIFCIIYGWSKQQMRIRFSFAATGLAMVLMSLWVLSDVPSNYKVAPLVDVIFDRILPNSTNPDSDLNYFGLDKTSLRYSGMHAFLEKGPSDDPLVVERLRRLSWLTPAYYYFRHPSTAIRFMWQDLRGPAASIRPVFLGNYRKQDGYPPRSLSYTMPLWSASRAFLIRHFAWHIPLLYALSLIGWGFCSLRVRYRNLVEPFGPLIPLLVVAGLTEFCAGSLMDSTETGKHLFVFHLITDVLICLLAGGGLHLVSAWRASDAAERFPQGVRVWMRNDNPPDLTQAGRRQRVPIDNQEHSMPT